MSTSYPQQLFPTRGYRSDGFAALSSRRLILMPNKTNRAKQLNCHEDSGACSNDAIVPRPAQRGITTSLAVDHAIQREHHCGTLCLGFHRKFDGGQRTRKVSVACCKRNSSRAPRMSPLVPRGCHEEQAHTHNFSPSLGGSLYCLRRAACASRLRAEVHRL